MTDKNTETAAPQHAISPVRAQHDAATQGGIIHLPVNARGVALTIIATVAFVFALSAAHAFFIPLLFGIFIAYTLNPLVV